MFIPTAETDIFVTEVFNSMVKAERTGLPGEEKEKNVLADIYKIITDPKLLPALVALFGPTKMIPLTLFTTRLIIRILNTVLGHDWINKARGLKKDDK